MGRPRKYRIIENIDQVKGVTVEQLLDQAHYFAGVMKESFSLNDESKLDAIHDTVMNVYGQMQKGNVDRFDYMKFKDYFFIALKTQFISVFQAPRRIQRNQIFNGYTSIEPGCDSANLGYESQNHRLQVKEFYSNIPENCREIFDALMAGEMCKDIRIRLKMPLHVWTKKMNRLKKLYQAIF